MECLHIGDNGLLPYETIGETVVAATESLQSVFKLWFDVCLKIRDRSL